MKLGELVDFVKSKTDKWEDTEVMLFNYDNNEPLYPIDLERVQFISPFKGSNQIELG